MLCQRLWIMACYAEPVVVNHGVLYGSSGSASWCVILSQWLFMMMCIAEKWLWIMVSFTVPVVVNHCVLCWVSGFELCCAMLGNNSGLYCASGCELVMLCQLLWVMVSYIVPRVSIMVCNAEPVVVNHGVLCWTSGCESCCVMLWQWLWIMVRYNEPVGVNHGVLLWGSGCESWWVMMSQWFWIVVCYAEPMILNHVVLLWASQWL